jgi:hypothetical protein
MQFDAGGGCFDGLAVSIEDQEASAGDESFFQCNLGNLDCAVVLPPLPPQGVLWTEVAFIVGVAGGVGLQSSHNK